MISSAEIQAAAKQFGVPETQIVRDHLISHVLSAIGCWSNSEEITFFGGTALCRTWLPNLRLSEDIDLLVSSTSSSDGLRQHTKRQLRSEFPNLTWTELGAQHQVETWTLSSDDLEVKVQFVQWRYGWRAIPIVSECVDLRYSDLPASTLMRVPTPSGFAAMKLIAWFDRHSPRHLFDLAALAEAKHIDHAALKLTKNIAGYTPDHTKLERSVPSVVASTWPAELGHQLANTSTAEGSLAKVRAALTALATDN